MRVIVKGSQLHAEQAAQYRDIPATFVYTMKGESVLDVQDSELSKVVRWFCEIPETHDFPPGTCLYYKGIRPTMSSSQR